MTLLPLSATQAPFTMPGPPSVEGAEFEATDFSHEWEQAQIKAVSDSEIGEPDPLPKDAPIDPSQPNALAPADHGQSAPQGEVEEDVPAPRNVSKDAQHVARIERQTVNSKPMAVAAPAVVGPLDRQISNEGFATTTSLSLLGKPQAAISTAILHEVPRINSMPGGQTLVQTTPSEASLKPGVAPNGGANSSQMATALPQASNGEPVPVEPEATPPSRVPAVFSTTGAQSSVAAMRTQIDSASKERGHQASGADSVSPQRQVPQVGNRHHNSSGVEKMSLNQPDPNLGMSIETDSNKGKIDQSANIRVNGSATSPTMANSTPIAAPVHVASVTPDPSQDLPQLAAQLSLPPVGETEAKPATASPQSTTSKPELPQAVVRQLAVVLPQIADRPIEVLLNPEELGRVRMVMLGQDAQMVVQIQADKAETTELIRRHLDMLAQDFHDLGYTDISFSFSGQHDHPDAPQGGPSSNTETTEMADAPPAAQLMLQQSGLDMRL